MVMKVGEGARRSKTGYRLLEQRLQTSLKDKDLGVSTMPVYQQANIKQMTSAANAHLVNLRVAFRNLNKKLFRVVPEWNPHLKKHVKKQEKVKKYATSLVTEL